MLRNSPLRALVLLSALNLIAPSQPPAETLTTVPRAALCVTEGAIEPLSGERMAVNVPKMRAYLNETTPQSVQAQFTYLGPTANTSSLGSGAFRTQFGFKLHAQDPCNLIYAMWRIEPESRLVVSVKSNPGQHTSAQCANRGYQNIRPVHSKPVPALHSGDTHWFRAEMNGQQLTVFVDKIPVWQGSVPAMALSFNGPVGIRSDNAHLQLELHAAKPLAGPPRPTPSCRASEEE
jgi:hypothetical protein